MAKKHRKKSFLIPILLTILLLLCGVVGWMLYILWGDSRQVFQDVTLELGRKTLTIQDFLTPLGNPDRASFVTDPGKLDLTRVGRTSLTLRHGTQTRVVNLNIVDTTSPIAAFVPEYTVALPESLPQAGALVDRVEDLSPVRTYYAQEPEIPADYSDITVTIVVEDTSGNAISGECVLHFTGWLQEKCTLELGQTLTPEMLLIDPARDADLLNSEQLREIGKTLGDHTLLVETGATSAQCIITVQDTTPPELTLRNIHVLPGDGIDLVDFIVSATDLSGEPDISLREPFPDFDTEGTYKIGVIAKDSSGNATENEAILWISKNQSPPVIQGASSVLKVKVNATPDFMKGVSARDDIDPNCDVTVDTSALDLSKPGSYTITYSAIDSSGNIGTCQRTVVVE